MIVDRTVEAFLDDLASASTTPGGGSAGALMGAIGAALVAMVCRLTIGRSGYEAVDAEMQSVLAAADAHRARLTAMVERDVEAFESVMRAYRLPKDTAVTAAARGDAIQSALQVATEVPLDCARASAAVIALATPAAERGNRTAASDAGAGAVAARAALQTAALNVHANAALLTDRAYADARVREVDALLAESAARLDAIRQALARRR